MCRSLARVEHHALSSRGKPHDEAGALPVQTSVDMKSVRDWYSADAAKWLGSKLPQEGDRDEARLAALEAPQESAIKWLHAQRLLDLKEMNVEGRTVALMAADNGSASILKWLYSQGLLDVKEKDNGGFDVSRMAALWGDESILRWLHSLGLLDTKETDFEGRNVALLAAHGGHLSILQWLHSQGLLDVAAQDYEGICIEHSSDDLGHESLGLVETSVFELRSARTNAHL